ncbi:MAG: cation:proton antiporter [Wenzhouxiangellaceae bacterium]|nr:cation:proton antiporter [Wenzhouxiangellaceae bacterium]MBS3746285.1 cation:proton antiporter [Wenzhouxiangellaceae bacterium]MBS3823734.1 cation:proton antiporter [Wenzhouxiangellaceae bacterium]
MHADAFIQLIFLIFTGAAVIATAALYARQALPVAYIVLGALLGPWGFGLVGNIEILEGMAEFGIIFLLFLLGLNLEPRELLHMLREAVMVTLVTCVVFFAIGAGVAIAFGLDVLQAVLIGAAVMFSSTILGLKLLPTSTLHHQRLGEIIVAILLLQDIIAIAVILFIQGFAGSANPLVDVGVLLLTAPLLFAAALGLCRYGLMPLMQRFDQIQEYVFLSAIGWCMAVAVAGHALGMSYEIGAFIAGVAIATSPISRVIAGTLKPLRDFFLVVFFFSLGARFDMSLLPQVFWPALTLAGLLMLVKPLTFAWLFRRQGEKPAVSREIGIRLGQVSEFSLLVAVVGLSSGLMTDRASYIVQATTILTFIASTYWIVLKVPSPIAISESLRRD